MNANNLQLLYALNAAADLMRRSTRSQMEVFDAYRNEVARLGFRGGLSLLDDTGECLVIKTIVQPVWIVKILADLEKYTNYKSEGYSFPYTQVSVYAKVIETRKAIFITDSSSTISEMLPGAIRSVVGVITSAIGTPPGIYAPLTIQERTIGVLNIMGEELTLDEVPAVEAFANLIAIALENARLFSDLQIELVAHKDLIDELENKNAELERFIYTVSHDLKSPLVTIKGFLGYIEQDVVTGNIDRLKGDIRRISDAVEKMGQLLKGLLDLSRIGRFVKPAEMISFEELVRESIRLLDEPIRERGIRLELQSKLPVVNGDRQRLVEALQNLLENAIQYIGDQSKPLIEIGQRSEEDGKPVFFVKDNGIGIAPEYHERVFGLFEKLDPKSKGTGIGLTLVKRIIEFHGGRIWLEGELGKGSTFYFTLPLGEPEG